MSETRWLKPLDSQCTAVESVSWVGFLFPPQTESKAKVWTTVSILFSGWLESETTQAMVVDDDNVGTKVLRAGVPGPRPS